ncbi:MAG TPA: alpha-amylase family protein [Armatimonadota bacterium]|nr:alpha-amylase family protein [Armatimonadota bacterium]
MTRSSFHYTISALLALLLYTTSNAISTDTLATQQPSVTIQNGQLTRGSQPFFPVGFVFGSSDAEMEQARAFGANSIHFETSPASLFPESAEKVSPDGLAKLKTSCDRARQHNLALFLLVNGHYLPGWVSKTAGGPPVDIAGKHIGLWFKHSIHNPVFQSMLERYWTLMATEFGTDGNIAAFVNWNEPGYGLDATPDGLRAYRQWLAKNYTDVQAMNQAFGTNFTSFDTVLPPKQPEDNRRFWYAWVQYNQHAFADFFAREAQIFHAIVPQVKITSKHPATALVGDAPACNDIVLQAATQDIYGCDDYNGSLFHYRDCMEVTRSLNPTGPVITFETRQQKSTPALPPPHAAMQLMAQIIGGCRGMFYFCFGNDKGYGFLNDQATPPSQRAEISKLFQLINAHQDVFAAPREKADIAVLLASPAVIQYGMGNDPTTRDEYTRRVSQTYDMIRNQHFAVDFISDRQLATKLGHYKLLVIPSLSIVAQGELASIAAFHAHGGRIIAFGNSLARDENFEPIPLPAFLGLKSRTPAPWSRGQMRLTSVAEALYPVFRTELIVQTPEIVNGLPMEQLIPGYIPKTNITSTALAGNQDAYPSIIQSTDGQVVYCAFDSLYSEGLSQLLGGIVHNIFGLPREVSATRGGEEAIELMTAINSSASVRSVVFANAGPNAGQWDVTLADHFTGKFIDIASGKRITVKQGRFSLSLPGYGYAVYRYQRKSASTAS